MWSRTGPPLSVVCFDNEVTIQSEILEVFPPDRAFFSCPLFNPESGTLLLDPATLTALADRFVAVIDVELFALDDAFEKFPWLQRADVLLIRARLGAFWSGKLDVCNLNISLQNRSFSLTDVLDIPRLSYPQAPTGRIILAYERYVASCPHSAGSPYRVNEAITYLSASIVRHKDFRLLAGRGSFKFAAGVHNPGAIVYEGRTYLLPRADRIPWAFQKADESLFFTSSQPLLFVLDNEYHVSSVTELSTIGLPNAATSRTGDFRLCKFDGQILTNHFVMSSSRNVASRRPLRIEELRTRVGISRLNIEQRQIIWCGFPTLDRRLAQAEKNWALFTNGEQLFLLYSFAPYILMTASHWPSLAFTTVVATRFTLPFDDDDLPLRNSINPVDYDDAHWLHIVHKVYPSKQYAFWAVLINKQTLQPVQMTARPLLRGWQSYPAAIIYTCSVIVNRTDILLFSGLDDSATAIAKIPRIRLDAEWIAIKR